MVFVLSPPHKDFLSLLNSRMAAPVLLARDDFPLLEVVSELAPDTCCHNWLDDVKVHEETTERRGCSKEEFARISDASIDVVEYMASVDILSACQFVAAARIKHRSTMKLDTPSQAADQSIYDPIRPQRGFAPPKRFIRTFRMSNAKHLPESNFSVYSKVDQTESLQSHRHRSGDSTCLGEVALEYIRVSSTPD
jgi:hypothetical protein